MRKTSDRRQPAPPQRARREPPAEAPASLPRNHRHPTPRALRRRAPANASRPGRTLSLKPLRGRSTARARGTKDLRRRAGRAPDQPVSEARRRDRRDRPGSPAPIVGRLGHERLRGPGAEGDQSPAEHRRGRGEAHRRRPADEASHDEPRAPPRDRERGPGPHPAERPRAGGSSVDTSRRRRDQQTRPDDREERAFEAIARGLDQTKGATHPRGDDQHAPPTSPQQRCTPGHHEGASGEPSETHPACDHQRDRPKEPPPNRSPSRGHRPGWSRPRRWAGRSRRPPAPAAGTPDATPSRGASWSTTNRSSRLPATAPSRVTATDNTASARSHAVMTELIRTTGRAWGQSDERSISRPIGSTAFPSSGERGRHPAPGGPPRRSP